MEKVLKKKKKNNQGFTLTEVIVCIAILAIIMMMVVVLSDDYVRTRKTIELRQNVTAELDNVYEEFSSNPKSYYESVLETGEENTRTLRKEFRGVDNYLLLSCERTLESDVPEPTYSYELTIEIYVNGEKSFEDNNFTRTIIGN